MTPTTPMRLAIHDSTGTIDATGPSLLAAFATSDLRNIDEHFGSATRFAVYRVFADRDESVSVTSFDAAKQDVNENKLAAKIGALEGCAAVFCQACGGSAIRQLMAQNIQPIKVDAGTTIAATLAFLRGEVAKPTAPWIVKALARAGKQDEGRFAAMASESWEE
jgi:nitrogen fixation protein NifX